MRTFIGTPGAGPRLAVLALACILVAVPTTASEGPASAESPTESLTDGRRGINRVGMSILAGWAAANLIGGGIGALVSQDEWWSAFHLSNAAWNVVNAGLAIPGLISSFDDRRLSTAESLREQQTLEAVLLLNAGLDVAYMVAGGGLLLESRLAELGSSTLGLTPRQLAGAGGALIFVFDLVMYFVHRGNTEHFLEAMDG